MNDEVNRMIIIICSIFGLTILFVLLAIIFII